MIPAKGKTLNISSASDNIRLVERLVEDVCEVFNVNEDCYGNRSRKQRYVSWKQRQSG